MVDLYIPVPPPTAVPPLKPTTPSSPVPVPPLPPSPPVILPIEQDFIGAQDVTTFAEDHAATADSYIQQLGTLALSLVPPVITPVYPINTLGPAVTVPAPPVVEPIVWSAPPIPAAFNAQLAITDVFPLFTATPPTINFPNAPPQPFLVEPGAPAIDTNFTYPTVSVDLPAPPSLLSLQTYAFGGVTLPTLSATAPVLTIVSPGIVDYIPNAPYTDALLSEMQATLLQRLDIGNTGTNTGLPPAIEENIWNREREREMKQAGDAIAALDRMETMGYAFPPGVFIDAQIKIQTELAFVLVGSSRDIAVAQAKLEQDNIKMALDSATQLEGKLIDYANQTEQRRFETCKYMTDAGVAIYNAQIQAFTAQVAVYRATIDIYNAKIQGQMALVAAYRAELEAEMVKVQMNTALVQQYKVEVDAALASIEVFKGEIQIIQVEAQVESLKVQIFGQEVAAYAAQINAYTANVEAYKALLQGEQVKEQVFGTQADVFSTQVTAVAKEIDENIAVYKAQLDAYVAEYEGYKALVVGQSAQVQAIAAQNEATARIYASEVSGTSAYNDAIIKEWQAALDEALQATQVGVSAANMNAQLYMTAKSIATDAAKVGAQVEAQIAASALGSVTWASHRARQDNVNFGSSSSWQVSRSDVTEFINSNQTSNSASQTASNIGESQESVSQSNNTNLNIASTE
jgi:hypothetical protein